MKKTFSFYFFIISIFGLFSLSIVLSNTEFKKQYLDNVKLIKSKIKIKIFNFDNQRETKEIKKWEEIIKSSYFILSQREDFFPKKLFEKDFFIAMQIIESGYKKNAISKIGAYGLMQTTEYAIADVIQYLDQQRKKGVLHFSKLKVFKKDSWEIKEIKRKTLRDSDFARSIGKLYACVLYNKHNIGKDDYFGGNIEAAQRKIAYAYNGGPGKFKSSMKYWSAEMKKYAPLLLNYKKRIKNIRFQLKKANKKISDYEIVLLAMKMERKRNKYAWLNKRISLIKG